MSAPLQPHDSTLLSSKVFSNLRVTTHRTPRSGAIFKPGKDLCRSFSAEMFFACDIRARSSRALFETREPDMRYGV